MATEVFRRRMENEIDAVGKRAVVVGGAERGVDERQHAMAAADVGKPRAVDNREVGIGRRLADDHLRPRVDRRFHRVIVARLHLAESDAEAGQMTPAELAAAVVALIEEHHFLTGAEVGHEHADERGHAAGEEDGHLATVEGGEFVLNHPFPRIAIAAVFLAGKILLDEVQDRAGVGKGVGRCGDDRIGDRIGQFLPGLAGMDGGGGGADAPPRPEGCVNGGCRRRRARTGGAVGLGAGHEGFRRGRGG